MPILFTQKWFADLLFMVVSLAIFLLSAFEVWRRGWFRVRPVLSSYAWFLAIIGFVALVFYLLQIPDTIRYTACRAYLAIYHAAAILICFLEVAVLYEFLFRMAVTSKAIQRTAVAACIITIGLTAIAALLLMNQSPSKSLENASRLLSSTTSLALVVSGLLIFAIKKARSLFLETRLSLVFAAVTLYSFVDLLTSFTLRRSQRISLIVGDVISLTFSILLYRALKSGPATPTPVTGNSAGFVS